MTVRPGYGIPPLHLRQESSQLLKLFGRPGKKKRSGKIREYWSYPEPGVECIVSRRSHRVLSLFLKLPSLPQAQGVAWLSLMGADQQTIREQYSDPDLEGGAFSVSDGGYVGRWYSYDCGIGFHFDASDRVEMVSIFARKRKSKGKSAMSSGHAIPRSVAALRRV